MESSAEQGVVVFGSLSAQCEVHVLISCYDVVKLEKEHA